MSNAFEFHKYLFVITEEVIAFNLRYDNMNFMVDNWPELALHRFLNLLNFTQK